ncbi:recombinase family protein [Corynebacterium sp. CNCTC7651]|uniref:recombinase family protein n=1 Tax=Corynebacterium sp. CNCTC7651 TaxID=2815361 RepID=UPI001F344805|nr:recombinase family protein [Corynebacterium sp. CNCTC7651]
MATRAAIFVRISLDAAMDGLAIERQREDCKAIAKQRGWTVVHTYVDQSISKEAIARLEAKIRSLPRGAVHIPVLAVENPAQHFLDADLNIRHHDRGAGHRAPVAATPRAQGLRSRLGRRRLRRPGRDLRLCRVALVVPNPSRAQRVLSISPCLLRLAKCIKTDTMDGEGVMAFTLTGQAN